MHVSTFNLPWVLVEDFNVILYGQEELTMEIAACP